DYLQQCRSRDCEPSALETRAYPISMYHKRWFEAARWPRMICSLEMYLNQLHKQSVLNTIGF
ncbi:hypothetical protein, partial [Pseudomonas aeruginosa]|uniref:hypothetical protein n=1 Tax=Pseudomonas aeruginosa TaxID=287 RepID=UPI001EE69452